MPIYLHTYTYIHIRTYIHTYIYTYIHIHIHTYIHTYVHTYITTYIRTYKYIYICMPFYFHRPYARAHTQNTSPVSPFSGKSQNKSIGRSPLPPAQKKTNSRLMEKVRSVRTSLKVHTFAGAKFDSHTNVQMLLHVIRRRGKICFRSRTKQSLPRQRGKLPGYTPSCFP